MTEQWMRDARCTESDPEAWFPDQDKAGSNNRKGAKEICQSCPVRLRCLQYALDHRISHGIWGGVAERERQKLLARRAKANR